MWKNSKSETLGEVHPLFSSRWVEGCWYWVPLNNMCQIFRWRHDLTDWLQLFGDDHMNVTQWLLSIRNDQEMTKPANASIRKRELRHREITSWCSIRLANQSIKELPMTCLLIFPYCLHNKIVEGDGHMIQYLCIYIYIYINHWFYWSYTLLIPGPVPQAMEPAPPIGIHLQDLGTGRAWSPVEWEDTSTEDCKACQSLVVFKGTGVTGVSRGCCSGYLCGIYIYDI